MRRNKILVNVVIVILSFIFILPSAFAKQVWQNSPATEYDGLGSNIINNCVLFARYKVPSLPYGLVSYDSKKNICNSHTAIVGEIAVLPQYSGGYYGHVAYVEKVEGSVITILEGGANTGHINRRVGTESQLEIYGYYNPGGLSAPVNNSNNGSNTYTAYVTGTDGSLVINSRPKAGYGIGYIPEGASCTVYPDKQSGNWHWVSYNGVSGYSYGKYLSQNKPATASGSSSSNNQTAAISEGTYRLVPKCATGSALDIDGGSGDSEANVQIWSQNDTNAQKFNISKLGSAYIMKALCSGKVLDVYNGDTIDGTNVWQYDLNSSAAQKWYFENAGDGYYYIKSELGKYLDVNGAGSSDGTNVQIWSFNGSDAQKWRIMSVSASNVSSSNTRTGVIRGTDGSLVINSRPSAGYDIGYIPEGASCTVYPDKQSGNWYWVSYGGVSGYSYGKYIIINDSNSQTDSNSAGGEWKFPLESYSSITTYFSSSHPAIDFAAPMGTKVYAAKSGTIIKKYTGCNNWSRQHGQCKNGGVCNPNHGYSTASKSSGYCNDGFGNGYIIKHDDGTWAEYAHMNYLSDGVVEGGYVTQGTYIGGVSSTGVSTGPHLHFGLRYGNGNSFWNSTAFDPLDYIGTGK